MQVDHIQPYKPNNRIENLQLLTPAEKVQKSCNKPIISINIHTGEEKTYLSIKSAAIKLNISAGNISSVCNGRKHHKTAKSKNDDQKYRFEFVR